MAVTATNLTAGPGTLYTGIFGAAEPLASAIATAPGAPWTDAGGTQGGVKLTINQEYFELQVDQIVDVPGRRITKRDMQVATAVAEPTLANLKIVLNGGTITTATGVSDTYDPDDSISSTQPTYRALLFDGWAPNGKRRRVVARKVLSIASVESEYKKDGQTLLPVTFGAHWVSASIKPFQILDDIAP